MAWARHMASCLAGHASPPHRAMCVAIAPHPGDFHIYFYLTINFHLTFSSFVFILHILILIFSVNINLYIVDYYSTMRHPPWHRPKREPLRWVCGSYLRQSWNVEIPSSLQRVKKNSRWFSCVTQWERRSTKLDVSVAEHRWTCEFPWVGCIVLRQRWNDVLASSEQRVEMMNSRWLSCVM